MSNDALVGRIGAGVLYGGFGLAVLATWLGWGQSELQVVARAVPARIDSIRTSTEQGAPRDSFADRGPWQITGRVIYEGTFPSGATVWAVARRSDGQEHSPPPVKTDSTGAFDLGPIPADLGMGGATVTIMAKDADENEGSTLIGLAGGAGSPTNLSALLWVIVLFFASILIALFPWPGHWGWQTAKYIFVVALAFALTCTVLYQLGLGLVRVEEMTATLPHGSLRLGFATIFRGTYVEDAPKDWIFSLTDLAINDKGVVYGFGAPLWGLLLSVLGAGLFTVSLIVGGIRENFRSLTPERAKERVRLVVLHEFYVVFAPVGAILVYQALVAAGAASEPVTVGVVLLAAGVGLNVILNQALTRFSAVMGGDESPAARDANGDAE